MIHRRFWETMMRLSVSAAVAIVSLQSLWVGVDPSQWGDCLVGLGVRPPDSFASLWWCGILRELSGRMSPAELMQALRLTGALGLGLLTFQVFDLLDLLLPHGLSDDLRTRPFGWIIMNLVLMLGTFSFAGGDVLWRASRGTGLPLIYGILLLGVLRQVFGFLLEGERWRVPVAALLLGCMADQGFFGVVAFVVLWMLVNAVAFRNPDVLLNPLADVGARRRLVLVTTIFFVVPAGALLIGDYRLYHAFGGVPRSESVLIDFVQLVGGDVIGSVKSALSPLGWLFAALFAAGPLILTYVALTKLLDSDRLPSRRYVLALILSGLVAWTQLAPFPVLWWQNWTTLAVVRSELAKVIIALLNTLTLVWAFGVFFQLPGLMNFRKVVEYQYEDASAESEAERALGVMTRFNWGQKVLALALLECALFIAWPFDRQLALARMRSVIGGYCREVVRECANVSVLLTDGALDLGVELTAALGGQRLVALPMLSRSGEHETRIRQRAAIDEREEELLAQGAVQALRYWREDATNRLSDVALQFGFVRNASEADRSSMVLSGLAGFPGGTDRAAAADGIARARLLGARILGLCRKEDIDRLAGGRLTELFRFVQWRVAQMCRVRTAYAASEIWGDSERQDESLATQLDNCNTVLSDLKERLGGFRSEGDLQLTPEEGLRIALKRADFRLAKAFAETVLRRNPKDEHANFAMGMFYLVGENYHACVPYLERVLETKCEDAAVLNNLATAYGRMGDRVRALRYAERAHRSAPDNAVILENLNSLR